MMERVADVLDETLEGVAEVDILASDFISRYRNGERPTVEEYARRHVELSTQIREIFPLALSIEKIKNDQQCQPDGSATLAGRLLTQLGDFTILREIGRGGMGIVFEAQQESLARRVAIKILPKQSLLENDALARFHREAKTAAALHHSNIVPIFGTGEADGTHFLVMQLVRGKPLDSMINSEMPLDIPQIARIGLQVADALDYAHANGVLHRDIKPANILIEENGTAQITDFGLARNTQEDLTVTHTLSGSLRYMAPERFRGISTERTDVYSLGLTLFEMIARRPAFDETDFHQMMTSIQNPKPISLRKISSKVPSDFETIVLKAMQGDASARYESAAELKEDLRRFLADEPILARRVSHFERFRRWCKRNPKLAIATGVATTALLVATVASTAGYALTSSANQRTSIALERSEQSLQLALLSLDRVVDLVSIPTKVQVGGIGIDDAGIGGVSLMPTSNAVKVLESIQPLYERLLEQTPTHHAIIVQMTEASIRLAQIQHQLGRTSDASTTLYRSLNLLNERGDLAGLERHESQRFLGRLHNELGTIATSELQFDKAKNAYREAIRYASQSATSDRLGQLELAKAHVALGDPPIENRRRTERMSEEANQETLQHLQTAQEILDRLSAMESEPNSNLETLRARVGLAMSRLATSPAGKREKVEFAISILKKQLARSTDDVMVRYALVKALSDVRTARDPAAFRQNREANDRLKEALSELAPLRSRFPESPLFAFSEVQILNNLAAIAEVNAHSEVAMQHLRKAIDLQTTLLVSWPDNVAYRCWRAQLFRSVAEISIEKRDLAGAKLSMEKALEDLAAIPSENANHPFVMRTRELVTELKRSL